MSVSDPFEAVPSTEADWLAAATKARVADTSLLGFRNHQSGSKVTKAQFLAFRTLVISWNINQFDPASWLDGNSFAIATQDVNNKPNAPEPLGGFAQIPLMHKQTLNHINRNYPKKLQSTDESPVNSSLIFLLNAIINIRPNSLGWWRLPKVRFEAVFGTVPGGRKRSMVAITDGQLQSKVTHEVWAVVECKSSKIRPQCSTVMMQEAALFVAWMREFPGHPAQRVLVSQDGLFLFITFAEVTLEWRDFLLRNRTSGQRYFLTLHRYGPWDLRRVNHVRQVAAILLAITR